MKTILITRSIDQHPATINHFKGQGYNCYSYPLTKIIYFSLLPSLYQPTAVVITSQHAAFSFKKLNLDKNVPLFIVGLKSAHIVTKMGYTNIVHVKEKVDTLNMCLYQQPWTYSNRILYLRGLDITTPLVHSQAQIKNIIAYQAQLQEYISPFLLLALRNGCITKIAFFSKRIAQHFEFLAQTYQLPLNFLTAFCLSPNIAVALQKQWGDIKIMEPEGHEFEMRHTI